MAQDLEQLARISQTLDRCTLAWRHLAGEAVKDRVVPVGDGSDTDYRSIGNRSHIAGKFAKWPFPGDLPRMNQSLNHNLCASRYHQINGFGDHHFDRLLLKPAGRSHLIKAKWEVGD